MQVSRNLVRKIYKKRPEWSHKGDFGRLLIVGGSYLYSGSPIFNGIAAYRAGCDLVEIASPEPAAKTIKSYSPDLIVQPLIGDVLQKRHLKIIMNMQKKSDAMIIGCGLTRNKQVLSAIQSIIEKTRIPTVVDADALHAVNGKLKNNFVLTPNSYEFSLLCKKSIGISLKERCAAVRSVAEKYNCTVLLKGHVDVISDGKHVMENHTGNVFMTKGGFGDVLAGICGALLARDVQPFEAACASAYISGRAGDMAAKKFGEGTTASDVLGCIPKALK